MTSISNAWGWAVLFVGVLVFLAGWNMGAVEAEIRAMRIVCQLDRPLCERVVRIAGYKLITSSRQSPAARLRVLEPPLETR